MNTMPQPLRLTDEQIIRRIERAPRLASLRSINTALSELVYAENSFTPQIAEVIRRDPSLTSRLLRLVNSVFFGLSQHVNNIEDAIFYLGLRQIRELALATPVIEDFERLNPDLIQVDWRKLWRHSIGTAILTRELLSGAGKHYNDDTDYIVGLVHNVGKILIASCFPEAFSAIVAYETSTTEEVCAFEVELIGWDHARIGAYYLEKHRLSPAIVEGVRWHGAPQEAGESAFLAAAVYLADHLARSVGIEGIEETQPVSEDYWMALPAWNYLCEDDDPVKRDKIQSTLQRSVNRLPHVLKGMI